MTSTIKSFFLNHGIAHPNIHCNTAYSSQDMEAT